jgi:haloalkane dehalogenase
MVRRGCDSVGDVDFLRTPDDRFADLPGFSFEPNYVDVTAGDGSGDTLRIHYVDEGDRTSGETVLLMHGEPSWSYLYRTMIPMHRPGSRRLRPLRQADAARRVHIRAPRRLDA